MTDASGPKKRDILAAGDETKSGLDDYDAVMKDLTSYYDDGSYSVKGQGDKFIVGGH